MSEENAGGDGQNGAVLNDPVDVIIDKLLRYDCPFLAAAAASFSRTELAQVFLDSGNLAGSKH